MLGTRERTIHYRRAFYMLETAHIPSLDSMIRDVHDTFSKIEDRRVDLGTGVRLECRRYRANADGVFMQIVAYSPGEEMSIVPHTPNKNDLDLDTTPPPKDADFWDGDINAYFSDNHVVHCCSNINEKYLEHYLVGMFQKIGADNGALLFQLRKTARMDKVNMIKSQGVKQIKLGTTMYEASLDHAERKSVRRSIVGSVYGAIREYFEDDPTLAEIMASENVSAEVVIKYDGRKKGGYLAHEKLEKIASSIVNSSEHDGNGFIIITGKNQKISSSDLSLSKSVSLPVHGKTINCDSAQTAILEYYYELREIGALEQ